MLLPKIESFADYRQIYRQEQVWLPAMRAICDRHGLDTQQLVFAPPGTHVAFSVGDSCHIKLFSPLWIADYRSESLVLHALASRSSLSVPCLLDEGEIEAWPYVILTTVPGIPLNQVWVDLSVHEKRRIAQACGRFLADLHKVPLEGLEVLAKNWQTFVQTRMESRIEQLRHTLGSQWALAAVRLFESQSAFLKESFDPVLLCADLTDEHVMVCRQDGQWSFSGVIDFGDAMVGHPLYEFAAPACSITRDDSALLVALLLGYGFTKAELTETLADQMLAYTLLHRYIDIEELLEVLGRDRIDTLDRLRESLWSFI